MATLPKNAGALGAVFLLLAATNQGRGGIGAISGPSALSAGINYHRFRRDIHRMVDMIDQFDHLNQLAFSRPQPIDNFSLPVSALTSQEPEPIDYDYTPAQNQNAIPAFNPVNLPDLSRLMEMAGPLMSMLSSPRK